MSQKVVSTRTIGTTEVTITYHSPLTKGRKIFGGIVPYDFVVEGKEYAWRAGSNNRTSIIFSHDVSINGNPLKAGEYGLVVLVSKDQWTFVFSSDLSWGAFQYDQANDVLRVPVAVKKVPHQEWLSYDFIEPQAEQFDIRLRWEEVSAAFTVSTHVNTNILADLYAKADKSARDYRVLAVETLVADPSQVDQALKYLEEAMARIDSMEVRRQQGERFSITVMKADLLIQKGEVKRGEKMKQTAINEAEGFNMYYYGLNTLMVKGDKKEAYQLLQENIQKHEHQWQGYLALGEYYLHEGDQKQVVANFKKAYELTPENWKNYARYLYLQNKLVLERS
ncbi:DUF2911 domain-containing protein [Reichenbachiella faecimaris]|nr:DUF2911 domain-containing protein [Reichenbachiella faecimaris]